jgi:hypothetical protein
MFVTEVFWAKTGTVNMTDSTKGIAVKREPVFFIVLSPKKAVVRLVATKSSPPISPVAAATRVHKGTGMYLCVRSVYLTQQIWSD